MAVHRSAADAAGIFANSYLVETRHGVVVIDGRLLTSDGNAVRARLEALGKPLLAVLVTHGHPDHYNGITEIVSGVTVPVLATHGVDRVIRDNDAAKAEQWVATFGAEWPPKRTFPNRTVKDGESVTFDGVTFTVHDLGPGESHSDSYWVTDLGDGPIAFIGDVVLQKDYLEKYRAAVKDLAKGQARLSDEQRKELVTRMKVVLPNDRLEFLIPLGADPVAAELATAFRTRD